MFVEVDTTHTEKKRSYNLLNRAPTRATFRVLKLTIEKGLFTKRNEKRTVLARDVEGKGEGGGGCRLGVWENKVKVDK